MTMLKARRTAAAQRDLEDIVFYIAHEENRPLTAEKVLHELQERCDALAKNARIATEGTTAPRIGEGVRLVAYKRWGHPVSLR